MRYEKSNIEAAVDRSGAQFCIDQLREESIFIRYDGGIVAENVDNPLMVSHLLWGQARRMYAKLSDALQQRDEQHLRLCYSLNSPEMAARQVARLNSCAGVTSGKWLAAFPTAWWPECNDGPFVMALRFRVGIPIGSWSIL